MRTPEEDTIFRWLWATAKVAIKLWLLYIGFILVLGSVGFGLLWVSGGLNGTV